MTIPQTLEVETIRRHLPAPEQMARMTVLEIGMPNPEQSKALRALGGLWCTVARSPAHARAAASALETDVACLGADGTVPYGKQSFDAVVVALDMFTAFDDPGRFIRECNRVLRPSGLLVLSTQTRRPMSIPAMRRRRAFPDGPFAVTYTDRDVYQIVKNGFDIVSVDSFSRFFVESVRVEENIMTLDGTPPEQIDARLHGRYKAARICDSLFAFLGKGHVLTFSARRRPWSERITPAFSSGRKLTQTVLFTTSG